MSGAAGDSRRGVFLVRAKPALPASIDETLALLGRASYVGDRALATVIFLSLRLGRPLFLEGEAGVGKTEVAKVFAASLNRRLIRLQCYEGLDVASAVYEWNYPAQMMAIRLAEASGEHDKDRIEHDIFSERYLIKRPLLQALERGVNGAPVLLIDEIDRADEAFEAYLLEILSDFQVTIPEIGVMAAPNRRSSSSPPTARAKFMTRLSDAVSITGSAILTLSAKWRSCAPRRRARRSG